MYLRKNDLRKNSKAVMNNSLLFIVIIYCILPFIVTIPLAFTDSKYPNFPPDRYSLHLFKELLGSKVWIRGALNSLIVALSTSIFATILGIIYSYCSFKLNGKLARLFDYLILLPVVCPIMVLAIGLFNILGEGGLAKLIVSHTILAIPFVVLTTTASLRTFNIDVEYASWTLGCSKIKTFLLVTLPGIKRAVLIGAILAFLVSWDELIIAIFITDSHTPTLPKLIWESLRREVDLKVAPVSFLIILINIFAIFIVNKYRRSHEDL
jgi:putative spermidine/putrescine transport system permease protein